MDSVKEAFRRVKDDINSIKQEMNSLRKEINYLHERLDKETISKRDKNRVLDTQTDTSTDSTYPSTHRQINSTDSTHPSTHRHGFKPLNDQNVRISTRNEGVSTDRQTDRQTHRQEDYTNFRQEDNYSNKENNSQQNLHYNKHDYTINRDYKIPENNETNNQQDNRDYIQQTQRSNGFHDYQNTPDKNIQDSPNTLEYPERQPNQQSISSSKSFFPQSQYTPSPYGTSYEQPKNKVSFPRYNPQQTSLQKTNNQEKQDQEQESMNNALEILNSLDSLKKEIRFKFKKLTDQEMSVFSTLYQLNEENEITNYKSISHRLNLSESSIRDYVGRLLKKGIPIEKKRINNKTIHLNISKELKNIATLPTILRLRDL